MRTKKNNLTFNVNNLEFSLKQGLHDVKDYELFIDYMRSTLPVESDIDDISNKWSSYYTWFFKIIKVHDHFHIVEMNFDLHEVEGIDYAIALYKKQLEICDDLGVIPKKCHLNDRTLISRDILKGSQVDVEGIRVKTKYGSSGWILVSDSWDESLNTLTRITLSEVAEKRVDLLPLLFLPTGYRFIQEKNNYPVEYDEEILTLENLSNHI